MSSPGHREHSEPHEPGPAPDAAAGLQVGIRRHGNVVDIVLTARDSYAAIALYDHLVRSMQQGSLRLDIARAPGAPL